MNLHLVEIARTVTLGSHAVVIMDQAGWHMTAALIIPENISIIPLPAKCPELNPVENIWQFMRDNWLSNRIFYQAVRRLTHGGFPKREKSESMAVGLGGHGHGCSDSIAGGL